MNQISRERLGAFLKEKRRLRRISRLNLAGQLGVSPGHINNLERGLRIPSFALLERVTAALGLTMAEVMGHIEGESEPGRFDLDGFGKWLARRRKSLGFSQVTLAEALGVDTSTVGKIEIGQRLPSFELFIRLSRTLAMSPATLMEILDGFYLEYDGIEPDSAERVAN